MEMVPTSPGGEVGRAIVVSEPSVGLVFREDPWHRYRQAPVQAGASKNSQPSRRNDASRRLSVRFGSEPPRRGTFTLATGSGLAAAFRLLNQPQQAHGSQ
ncbi:unnamed protein product [Boreogadus saida]